MPTVPFPPIATPARAYELAEAGRILAEAIRDCADPTGTPTQVEIHDALAAYDTTVTPLAPPKLAVVLPDTFLPRHVTLRVSKDGSRWIAEGEDANGQLYDVTFDGFTGRVRFASRAAATKLLRDHGGDVGERFWAMPRQAVRS